MGQKEREWRGGEGGGGAGGKDLGKRAGNTLFSFLGESANVQATVEKCESDDWYFRGSRMLECLRANVQNVFPHAEQTHFILQWRKCQNYGVHQNLIKPFGVSWKHITSNRNLNGPVQ